ncbi:MAG: hypothetical protein LCH37_07390 [Bacteroidetes bacterium]|nr:hypothetical protein [Bacteroidota bacterium]
MEENLQNQQEQQVDPNKPALYSRNAILFMSIIFASIFGGWMLVQNLRRVGNIQAALSVGIFSILFFILTLVLAMLPAKPIPFIGIGLNYIGGKILADYFLRTLIPGSGLYPKKSVWIPVIVSLLISGIMIAIAAPQLFPAVAK